MSKKKASGSSNQQTPRAGKRLGVKVSGGASIKTGQIIIRQRGNKFHPGAGTKQGRDFTLYAVRDGQVKFRTSKGRTLVEVV